MAPLIGATTTFGDNADGLFRLREQVITDEFLDELADERLATSNVRSGEYHRAAAVPTSVADIWATQGFDIYSASARAIVDRLRSEGLEHFIATSKRI
jgi:hypothetical protein